MNKGYLEGGVGLKPVESLIAVRVNDILEILPFSYLSYLLKAEVESSLILLLFKMISDRYGVYATSPDKLIKQRSVKLLLLKSNFTKF